MKIQMISALLSLSAATPALAADFLCMNKSDLQARFTVSVHDQGGTLAGPTTKCSAKYIPYRPNSPKYKGWVRVAPLAAEKGCVKFSLEVVGKPYDGDHADIHWLSISREMQAGQDGFAQLGVQNTADPGSGGTAKIFVRCFAKK